MRLIDADALKEQILDWISEQVVSKYISHDACMATREGARVAFNLLNDAPTIDAVQVVRCGECYKKNKSWCGMKHERADMDYCSCGERRKP
jgi:hypothetical protein